MTTEDSAGLARETLEPTTDMETEDPPSLQTERSEEDPNIDQEGKFDYDWRSNLERIHTISKMLIV
jgi:hypothetical protein